jgi:hypothetical protein
MDWRVWWAASDVGYHAHVCHGARIVHRYEAESLSGDNARELALAKAVELALKYRVPLTNVWEEPQPV